MIKKYFYIPIVAICAFALTGCNGSAPSPHESQGSSVSSQDKDGTKKQAKKETAEVGEEVAVATDNGNLTVTVEGLDVDPFMSDAFSDAVTKGNKLAMLLLVVGNESYASEYDDGAVDISSDVWLLDSQGITIDPMNQSLDYGQYEGAAGATSTIKQGQKKRIALFYQIPLDTTEMTASLGGTMVTVPVSES